MTRCGNSEHPNAVAVVMSDQEGGQKFMYVGQEHAGETFVDVLGHCGEKIIIQEDGMLIFVVK